MLCMFYCMADLNCLMKIDLSQINALSILEI